MPWSGAFDTIAEPREIGTETQRLPGPNVTLDSWWRVMAPMAASGSQNRNQPAGFDRCFRPSGTWFRQSRWLMDAAWGVGVRADARGRGEEKRASSAGAPMGHEDAEGACRVPAAECPDSKSSVKTPAPQPRLERFGTDVEKVCEKGTVRSSWLQAAVHKPLMATATWLWSGAPMATPKKRWPAVTQGHPGWSSGSWADCPAGDMLGPVAENHGADCHVVVAVAGDDGTIVGVCCYRIHGTARMCRPGWMGAALLYQIFVNLVVRPPDERMARNKKVLETTMDSFTAKSGSSCHNAICC